jgi:hypothetical protein
MEAGTPLWKAHDIGQQLQDKIEVLPNVERAFVHVDHETSHAPVRLFSSRNSSSHSLGLVGAPEIQTHHSITVDVIG